MLVLSIKVDEALRFSNLYALIDGQMVKLDDVTIMLCEMGRSKARLGITAPREIQIDRLDTQGTKLNYTPPTQETGTR